MSKRFLTAEELLASDDLQPKKVPVPEWTTTAAAYIMTLTADQRDAMEEAWQEIREESDSKSSVGFRAFVVAYCLCDDKGVELFERGQVAKAAKTLGSKRKSAVVSRLFNVACKQNGLLKEDIDQLEKNSESEPNAAGN